LERHKTNTIWTIFISLLILITSIKPDEKNKSEVNNYFPVAKNLTLLYNTSFGDESISKFIKKDNLIINSNESPEFKYYQTIKINEDGVFVTETYQYVKIFLFIKKESRHTYNKPLLRIPSQLMIGKEWNWEGLEYTDSDSSKVSVHGKVIGEENVITQAGTFKSLKVETSIENSNDSKNTITEWFVEGIGPVKTIIVIKGGGLMGFVRDLLGYKEFSFELKELKNN